MAQSPNVAVAALVDPKIDKALEKLADIELVTKSEVIRRALLNYITINNPGLLPKKYIPDGTELNEGQAAQYLGYRRREFAKIRMDGKGPPFKTYNKRILYKKEDLDRWKSI